MFRCFPNPLGGPHVHKRNSQLQTEHCANNWLSKSLSMKKNGQDLTEKFSVSSLGGKAELVGNFEPRSCFVGVV